MRQMAPAEHILRLPRSLLVVVTPMGGAVHGRRGRAPKTPTLLDVLWVRGRPKLRNHERSLPRVLDSNLRVTASPTRVSLGVASCQSEILSLKKAVWRLWLVSKSRTTSSAEGCEQLLRRVASVARPPSSPSHARTARRRLQATREIPPAIRHRRSAQGIFLRSSLSIRAARARHLSREWATISVIISRIPDGDKHRFVNDDFPFPKPDEPRLNSIETRERNWVKAPFRDIQATSAADNHKNIIVDRSSKAKLD